MSKNQKKEHKRGEEKAKGKNVKYLNGKGRRKEKEGRRKENEGR